MIEDWDEEAELRLVIAWRTLQKFRAMIESPEEPKMLEYFWEFFTDGSMGRSVDERGVNLLALQLEASGETRLICPKAPTSENVDVFYAKNIMTNREGDGGL